MKKTNKPTPLSATNSGPKPGDFPLGSAESRAAARMRVKAQDEQIEVLMVDGWPKNSELVQDSQGRYKRVLEQPVEGAEKPLGEAMFDGQVYEVYGSLRQPKLFLKAETEPLPTIRLPRAKIVVHVKSEGP